MPVLMMLVALLLFTAAWLISPGMLARYANDGVISDYSRYFLGLLRTVLAHAGFLSVLLAVYFAAMGRGPAAGDGEIKNHALSLFVVSFFILFMELAFIRWVPAYVKLMSYFTNFILLACFLGMGLGCLAAGSRIRFMKSVPALIAAVVIVSIVIYALGKLEVLGYSPGSVSKHEIFFGGALGETKTRFREVGISFIIGLLFALVALAFIGPGQLMGRMFERFGNPVRAYTVNVGASIAGILCMSALSFFSVPAWVWFAVIMVMLLWLIKSYADMPGWLAAGMMLVSLSAMILSGAPSNIGKIIWSPYYKIFYSHPSITVNEIGHQVMRSANGYMVYYYHLPLLIERDAGGRRFEKALVIGAGSGNDVSHVLKYGADEVDAIEIDPRIIGLGRQNHPDRPYDDPRVTVINDDGRSFLRRTDKKYDLIIYGLVDSLTLMSGFSSIRLENYLFTREAFEDVRRHLKPGGVFVMYNYFRENWLTIRLYRMLEKEFGREPVLVINPPEKTISEQAASGSAISIFMAGDIGKIKEAFGRAGAYSMLSDRNDLNYDFNGFYAPPADRGLLAFYDVNVGKAGIGEKLPADDWPFVYLRRPGVPAHNIWGLALVAAAALVFVGAFTGGSGLTRISLHYFFLGGAFMLLETESIVKLALIHGSTWFVNSVVFVSVLVMIFLANLFVMKRPPRGSLPVYALLFASLLFNYFLPLEAFLGKSWLFENVLSSLVLFAPIAFAAVIFANSFRRSRRPALDLGSNLLGVIAGGLAEYASLALGYNALLLLAIGMYAVSFIAIPQD